MPISKYYQGHGSEVMREMLKRYGDKGKQVFYATANKRGLTVQQATKKKRKKKKLRPSDNYQIT